MVTNIPSSHPAIEVLRRRVEQQLGLTIDSQQAVCQLEQALHFVITEDTLRRIWGLRQDGYPSFRHNTLDVLAQYVGEKDWSSFAVHVQSMLAPESLLIANQQQVCTDDMQIGEMVEITWLPDRECLLRYEGETRWKVLRVKHSSTLTEGDTFACRTLAKGQEMIADDVLHMGQHYAALKVGKSNGITAIRRFAPQSADSL